MSKSGNLSKDVFDFVRDTPCTSSHAMDCLEAMGYIRKSISSILTQMKRDGMVRQEGDLLFTTIPAYRPIKSSYVKVADRAKPVKKTSKQGIAALQTAQQSTQQTLPVYVDTVTTRATNSAAWNADTVLANIGIKEAHRLYLELHTYFGGK